MLLKNWEPKYAEIKIPYTSPAARFTQKKAQITRLKEEIKFLYKKVYICTKYWDPNFLRALLTYSAGSLMMTC